MLASQATAIFADDDTRRACDAMKRDIRAALSEAPPLLAEHAGDEAVSAYARSLVRRDLKSWRAFYAALARVTLVADTHSVALGTRFARARLQAFLDENRDLS